MVCEHFKATGMIQKGNWILYELKLRDVERQLFTCEILLQRQRRKGFLQWIVTDNEKWIHYDNHKNKNCVWQMQEKNAINYTTKVKYSLFKGYAMYLVESQRHSVKWAAKTRWNNFWSTAILTTNQFELCIERKNGQNMPRETKWLFKMTTQSCVAKLVKDHLEALGWDVQCDPLLLPNISHSDYQLFWLMTDGQSEQCFSSYEDIKKGVDEWIASKDGELLRLWNPPFLRKMEKSSGLQWTILWNTIVFIWK